MSYHIYTTDSIILKRRGVGEGNVLLHILTKDLGLIVGSAQAARHAHSKLKGALQEYTNSTISAVKGKNGWKITSASSSGNFFFNAPEHVRRTLSQIISVLVMMMPGEIPHPEIFAIVKRGLSFLETLSPSEAKLFEYVMLLRILRELGYVESGTEMEKFFSTPNEWDKETLESIAPLTRQAAGLINKAFKASQLS